MSPEPGIRFIGIPWPVDCAQMLADATKVNGLGFRRIGRADNDVKNPIRWWETSAG